MAVVSSCREMLGQVPQRAQPLFLVACKRYLEKLPVINWRKVRMTSSHHAPYTLGYTRATLGKTKSCESVKIS
jgi:hypothetical protein